MGRVEGRVVQEAGAGERLGVLYWLEISSSSSVFVKQGRKGCALSRGEELRIHTIRVKLQDMQIAICVPHDDVQLLTVGQEIGGDGLDVVWRFAEKAELVRILLFRELSVNPWLPQDPIHNRKTECQMQKDHIPCNRPTTRPSLHLQSSRDLCPQ